MAYGGTTVRSVRYIICLRFQWEIDINYWLSRCILWRVGIAMSRNKKLKYAHTLYYYNIRYVMKLPGVWQQLLSIKMFYLTPVGPLLRRLLHIITHTCQPPSFFNFLPIFWFVIYPLTSYPGYHLSGVDHFPNDP